MSDQQSTILMLQWCIWKTLPDVIVMTSEQYQRVAEHLSEGLYRLGVRLPKDDDPVEVALDLQSEIRVICRDLGPVPVPLIRLTERYRVMSSRLSINGWRKYG